MTPEIYEFMKQFIVLVAFTTILVAIFGTIIESVVKSVFGIVNLLKDRKARKKTQET